MSHDRLESKRTSPTVARLYVVLVPGDVDVAEGVCRSVIHLKQEARVAMPLITDDPDLADTLLARGREEFPEAYLVTFYRADHVLPKGA